MNYPIYLLFGIAPSLIWLCYYLKKDPHPESKEIILRVFLLGMGSAVFAAGIENFISSFILFNIFPEANITILAQILYIFLGIAFVEEFTKYFAVKNKYIIVKKTLLEEKDFDEPLDVMIYMIVSALGFAAVENTLLFFSGNPALLETFFISGLRFAGATFLHTLCSGIIGYFIALSFYKKRKRKIFSIIGLSIATLLHGLYNFSIIKIKGNEKFLIPIFVLIGSSIFISFAFKRLINKTNRFDSE
ncbi:MAG: PrsW family intramembrane metalloprotease [Candidatus Pacebacteria bacterium]|nr:PrsW family intramembrane metalloprotease [Candidatus Paceibacterota bacterium]